MTKASHRKPDPSFVRQFAVSLALAMAGFGAMVVLLSFLLSTYRADVELSGKADEHLAELVEILKTPLWNFNDHEVRLIGSAYARNEILGTLRIEGPNGATIFALQKPDGSTSITRQATVNYHDQTIGIVFLEVSQAHRERARADFLWSYLTTAGLMGVAALVFSLIGLRLFIKQPFQQFSDLVDSFSKGNEKAFDKEPPYLEFAPLIEVLGRMSKTISSQFASLRESRAKLETTVEERTLELQRFHCAVEQGPVSVMITDLQGRIEYVNPRFTKITGYQSEEVVGKNPRFLKSGKTTDKEYKVLWETITSGYEWNGVFENMRKDGSFFQEHATISPVKNEAGKIINFVAIKEDVTQQLELERQLQQSQKMESLGQMTGGVAHDFNNLLAIMMGNVEMLADKLSPNQDTRQYVEALLRAVEKGESLTNRLLVFSRTQQITSKPTNLSKLLGGLEEMLRSALGESHGLQVHVQPDLWPALVDPAQLEHALVNIVVNSRAAMDKGGDVSITITNTFLDKMTETHYPDVKAGDYVLIEVADNGKGISPEVLDRVFEPFFTTKEVGAGTGLGLSMVYGFVKQSKGLVTVESKVGRGTTLRLYLPRAQSNETEDVIRNSLENELPLGKARILLLEDDAQLREIPLAILREQGYDVTEAGDGEEAISILNNESSFDLLFTDVVLPNGKTGVDVAKEAKRLQPGIQVLFTTGYTEAFSEKNEWMQSGEGLLNKPYRKQDLLERVHTILRQQT